MADEADGRVARHAEVAAGQHLPGEGRVQPPRGVPDDVTLGHDLSLPEGEVSRVGLSVAPVARVLVAVAVARAVAVAVAVARAVAVAVARAVAGPVRGRGRVVRVVGGGLRWPRGGGGGGGGGGGIGLAGVRVG